MTYKPGSFYGATGFEPNPSIDIASWSVQINEQAKTIYDTGLKLSIEAKKAEEKMVLVQTKSDQLILDSNSIVSQSISSIDTYANIAPNNMLTSAGTAATTAATNATATVNNAATAAVQTINIARDNALVSLQGSTFGAVVTSLGYTPVNKAGDVLTGQLVLAAGSASSPALAVAATNLGLFRPATDTLAVTARGLEVARFKGVASGVNSLAFNQTVSGSPFQIAAQGTDANVGIQLAPKGTGVLSVTSAVQAPSFAATGSLSGASVTATGTISGASVTATGAVSGSSVTASGAISGASLSLTGSSEVAGLRTHQDDAHNFLKISGKPGWVKGFEMQSNGAARWQFASDNEWEGGNNAGSDFYMARHADNGDQIEVILQISRSTGVLNFNQTPTINDNPIWHAGNTTAPDARYDARYATGLYAEQQRIWTSTYISAAAATVEFDIPDGWRSFRIMGHGLRPSAESPLYCQVFINGAWQTTGYHWQSIGRNTNSGAGVANGFGGGPQASWQITAGMSASVALSSVNMTVDGAFGGTYPTFTCGSATFSDISGNGVTFVGGHFAGGGTVDRIRFFVNGNLIAGQFSLHRIS